MGKLDKPNWVEILVLILLLYSAIYLYLDRQPNVVHTVINCPESIWMGENIAISLHNYGGSNTDYTLLLSANGFKCFEGFQNGWSADIIKSLNEKYNQSECIVNYFIGEGSDNRPNFVIFTNTTKPQTANFTISYTFTTMFILPLFKTKMPERIIESCNCEYDKGINSYRCVKNK